ncbi:MAG: short-chain dehydrogenase/reductase [Bradyrhizobium sp.]|jgi:3-oxoacyl-[acyl-carrier protein] reductase|nr:short-chain dehydrogenase/reductase [Bradyrhizobium sp.]
MTKSLAGKSALVSGGSRDIGAATARRLAKDGAAVAFTYAVSTEKAAALVAEIEADGSEALAINADSADPKAVQRAVAQTAGHFGRLDILVNNAGILLRGPVDTFSLADFDRMIAVNVRAVFVAVQSALAHMGEGGRIITVGSVTAERSGFPGASVYSMTKAAVAALTRGLARDLGSSGITVNTVQPGPTETDMNPDENIRAMLRPMLALGRIGKDSEIASLIAYLASPEASFVTGAAFTIDGGYLS